MKVTVIGAGRVGSVCVNHLIRQDLYKEILVVDINIQRLLNIKKIVSVNKNKITIVDTDIKNKEKLKSILIGSNLIICAISWDASKIVVDIALECCISVICAARPNYSDYMYFKEKFDKTRKIFLVFGCGLEPGLTEILGNYAAEAFDTLNELHIKCGGISKNPTPPLNYKLVYGDRLPFDKRETYEVVNGSLIKVPKFSGVEYLYVEQVGELEAWHDGMLPWFANFLFSKNVKCYTQKTLRWKGFSNVVALLDQMGMLNETPITIGNQKVIPREVVEAVFKPLVTFTNEDRDMVLLLIKASGVINHKRKTIKIKLIDYFDELNGVTAMARTTGLSIAIIANLMMQQQSMWFGVLSSYEVLKEKLINELIKNLTQCGINISIQETEQDGATVKF